MQCVFAGGESCAEDYFTVIAGDYGGGIRDCWSKQDSHRES